MIDFRYHLVSLVSVFLALAVGIVLGAGPLKEQIGTELTKSVEVLRAQKVELNAKLDTSEAAVSHRDDFLVGATPSLVAGQLTGRSVILVVLPGVDDSKVVDELATAIKQAGGTVSGRISIGSSWADPDQADARSKAIIDLSSQLPGRVQPDADPAETLPSLLASSLVGLGSSSEAQAGEGATIVLKALRSAKLIGIKGDVPALAGAALILSPGNPDGGDQKVLPTAGDTSQETAYVKLVTAMDSVGGGAVVSGPASSAAGSGLLAAVRDDDVAKKAVSTVDTGTTSMGVITAVLALHEQLDGGAGAYGFVGNDTKMMPILTVPVPVPSATKK